MQLTLAVYVCVGFDPGNKVKKDTKSNVRMKHYRYRVITTSFNNLWLKKFN